jgi:hypothetical protein
MKNTLKVLSVRVFGIIAFMAIFILSATACSGQTINSPEALKDYLNKQPANSRDKPIKVSMGANEIMLPKIRDVLNSTGKYVSLNLTGNALTTIPSAVFYDEKTDKGCETLVSVTIPNSVIIIEGWAFYCCTNLTSVTIPNSVTSIEGEAFSGCTSLASITIPDSVTNIETQAFRDCDSLTSVTIPNSVTSIEFDAFNGCTKLTNVIFQGTISSGNFDERAFDGDLVKKYLAGGIGTYTTTAPVSRNSKWTKKK